MKLEKLKVVVVAFSGKAARYSYAAPESMKVAVGDRVVVAVKDSYALPTVVQINPTKGEGTDELLDPLHLDFVVQVVDRTPYEDLKRLQLEARNAL